MKILQFIEIGTFATPEDFKHKVGTIHQIPIDQESTPRQVYHLLSKQLDGNQQDMDAFTKFIHQQNDDNLDKNIFQDCNIKLKEDDQNPYYMIFHLMSIVNIMNNTKDDK